jgi:hypothetical protein
LAVFTEGLRLRQHQFEVRRPILEFAFCELAVGGAQAAFFPLATCPFYSIINTVEVMTVETRNIWDLAQEAPGALLHFGQAESTRDDKWGYRVFWSVLNSVVSGYN